MATYKLGDLVTKAYATLKELAVEFNRPGAERAYQVLSSLQAPALPEPAAGLKLEFPHGPGDDDAFSEDEAVNAAVVEATKLERAADVLADAGQYEPVDRLAEDARAVKDAVTTPDGGGE
jgi:hypothetical protein